MAAVLRLARSLRTMEQAHPQAARRALATLCRALGVQIGAVRPSACDAAGLTPRMRQTLDRLLAGDSEKQVAARLRISTHTVHIYVKKLYKRFNVSSRGELLAKCLRDHFGGF